ncbi:MAG: methyltransferase domain-containing protein [Pseudolabrys sp.]
MDATFLTSGNLIADRRFEWARDLADKGDLAGAADLLAQTLELAPRYAAAWFVLGETRERLDDRASAIAAFEQARAADPRDRHGAGLHLIRLGATPAAAMPEGYVRALFDGYAPGFDKALTQGLGYRAPELLLRAVRAAAPGQKFAAALDLGCGTGLAGAAFKPLCKQLTGIDLSPAMLAQARAKKIYDRLEEGDVIAFLQAETVRYDLIVAADVFMYLDNLTRILKAAARVLEPGAWLAFSVETHTGDGIILRDTLRYAHGGTHVREALAAAGLGVVSLDSASTRNEKGIPVPGLIVVAQRVLPPCEGGLGR